MNKYVQAALLTVGILICAALFMTFVFLFPMAFIIMVIVVGVIVMIGMIFALCLDFLDGV